MFTHVAQRRGFREYLAGLLAPRERNKTLTCLAGAEPVTGSKLPAVQRLQFFLSESVRDPGAVNARRLELLRADPGTAPMHVMCIPKVCVGLVSAEAILWRSLF